MPTEAHLKEPATATDACYRWISHSKLAARDEAGLWARVLRT